MMANLIWSWFLCLMTFVIPFCGSFIILPKFTMFSVRNRDERIKSSIGMMLETNAQSTSLSETDLRAEIIEILSSEARNLNVTVKNQKWIADRCEIVLDVIDENFSISADMLGDLHNRLYLKLSEIPKFTALLETTEILLSSAGIGEILRSDRDFVSFKGFAVTITLINPIKGAYEIKGTLVERDEKFIKISLKGRISKVARDNVAEVRLPKAKYEHDDYEIRKLQ